MQRDIDLNLACQILGAIDQLRSGDGDVFQPEIEGHSAEEVSFQIMLLTQGDFLEGEETPDGWYATAITLQGRQLLRELEQPPKLARQIGFANQIK